MHRDTLMHASADMTRLCDLGTRRWPRRLALHFSVATRDGAGMAATLGHGKLSSSRRDLGSVCAYGPPPGGRQRVSGGWEFLAGR